MSSDTYTRNYIDNMNRKNTTNNSKIITNANYSDNRNLAKIVHNRRNNSSDIRKEKIGKEGNLNLQDNDNDALSKLVTQVPKNGNVTKNISRPSTGAVNIDTKGTSDYSMNSPRPSTERVSYSMSPHRMKNLSYNKLLPPKSKENQYKKTLVLDLDETLVHSAFKKFEKGSDIVLKIELEGRYHDIHVLVRPGVDEFLEKMAKHYELIVFTASLSKYAEPLVDRLDPKRVCYFRLFREHCTMINGAFVKDLKRLDRDMKDIIILDNSPISYALNPENGFPSKNWYDDKSCRELYNIIPILEFLAYVNDVRDFIRKMVDRNEINYNKAFSIMNQYKKEMESAQSSQIQDKSTGKKNFLNVSGNYLQNSGSNNLSGKTTPKYSSNILNKKDSFTNSSNNNIKNNESNSENPDGKPISIKFINNNIHHYVINQNGNVNGNKPNSPGSPSNNNTNQQDYYNQKYSSNENNVNNNLNNAREQINKPEKKNKKINGFRNVAKPQTAMGVNYNSNKDLRTNNMKIPGQNSKISDNNLENYINKTPNTPHSNNLIKNNYDNIMVNYSQQMQPGMLNKFNMKQINVNNNEISPVNRATRGSLSLHSTINKNNSTLKFSKENQGSRPSSTNNKKQQNQNRDRSNNSVKDNYNNPTVMATIKRTPSTNSLVKSLTRNYSKQAVENENNNNNTGNQQRAFLNMNRQTPKNYSSNSLDLKNGDFVRNSYTGLNVNMVGIEKKKNNQKYLNANNLNIKSPTLNSIVDNEFVKRGYSLSSRSINSQIRFKSNSQNEMINMQSSISPNNRYTPSSIIRTNQYLKNERF